MRLLRRPPAKTGPARPHGRGRWRASKNALAAVILLVSGTLAPPALSEPEKITLELNQLQPLDNGCRITLLSSNRLEKDVERLLVELVLFDNQRRAIRFMRVALPPLSAGRSRAQIFDAKNIACADIADILLNNVVECGIAGIDQGACPDLVAPSSRVGADFVTFFDDPVPSGAD